MNTVKMLFVSLLTSNRWAHGLYQNNSLQARGTRAIILIQIEGAWFNFLHHVAMLLP